MDEFDDHNWIQVIICVKIVNWEESPDSEINGKRLQIIGKQWPQEEF